MQIKCDLLGKGRFNMLGQEARIARYKECLERHLDSADVVRLRQRPWYIRTLVACVSKSKRHNALVDAGSGTTS